jgi:hypothetical protein
MDGINFGAIAVSEIQFEIGGFWMNKQSAKDLPIIGHILDNEIPGCIPNGTMVMTNCY